MPPEVELKSPLTNFQETVYPRLKNPVMEVKQRDLLTNCIRARLFQQDRADDPYCQNPECRRENLVQDVKHIFCQCYKVRSAWQWTKRKVFELLTDQGRPPDISNTDILLAMFSKGRQDAECSVHSSSGHLSWACRPWSGSEAERALGKHCDWFPQNQDWEYEEKSSPSSTHTSPMMLLPCSLQGSGPQWCGWGVSSWTWGLGVP